MSIAITWEIITGVVTGAATLFGGGFAIGWKIGEKLGERRSQQPTECRPQIEPSPLEKKLDDIEKTISGEANIWLRKSGHDQRQQGCEINRSIPIVTIANFKGGVGKTTMSANLAAYFGERGKKVLLVDFDYQGSLSELVLPETEENDEEPSTTANLLIEGTANPLNFMRETEKAVKGPRIRIYPAAYRLNRIENQTLFKWLLNPDTADIRFNAHRVLSQPGIQDEFDIVIIDAPPRLMTATVNAACASTHVLVPTSLDRLSVPAALKALGVFHQMRSDLCPSLQLLGVVPTMINRTGQLSPREKKWLKILQQQACKFWPSFPEPEILVDVRITRKEGVVSEDVFGHADAREMYGKLGEVIATKLRLFDESPRPPRRPQSAHEAAIQLAG